MPGIFSGRSIRRSDFAADQLEHVLAKTSRRGNCRLWTGACIHSRTGNHIDSPVVGVAGKQYLVRRLVYALVNGECPAGIPITNSCGADRCVAPDHLRHYVPGEKATSLVSTALAAKVRRMWKTNSALRIAGLTGLSSDVVEAIVHNHTACLADPTFDASDREHVHTAIPAKLTEADVRAARKAVTRGVTVSELAERYGVVQSTMSDAVNARTFKWVPERVPPGSTSPGRRRAKR